MDKILLIPTDPALLAEGPCRSRPPTLRGWSCDMQDHPVWWSDGHPEAPMCGECGRPQRWPFAIALVLASEGKPVWQGCEVARRAHAAMHDIEDVILHVLQSDGELIGWLHDVCAPIGVIVLLHEKSGAGETADTAFPECSETVSHEIETSQRRIGRPHGTD